MEWRSFTESDSSLGLTQTGSTVQSRYGNLCPALPGVDVSVSRVTKSIVRNYIILVGGVVSGDVRTVIPRELAIM